MQAVEMLGSYFTRGVYTVSGPFHPFGGAVDIIVVEQEDGGFKSSPWYVRFGKFQGVLKAKENLVRVVVNGADAGFHMHLDHKGEAYFLMELDPDDGDLEAVSRIDLEDGKIVARTDSRRIFGLFGRKSKKGDGDLQVMSRLSSLERAEIAADLLETKWSTSLPAGNRRGKKPPSGKDVGEEDNNKNVCKDIVNSCNIGGDTANDDDYVVSNSKRVCVENVMAKDSESLTVHGKFSGGRNRNVYGPPHEQLPEMTSTGEARELDSSNNTTANFNSSNFILHCERAEEAVDGSLASDGSKGRNGEGEVASYIYYEEIETSTVRFNAAAPSSLDLYPVMNERIENNEKFTQETNHLSNSPNLESPSDDLRTELSSLSSTREDSFGESSSQRSIGKLESEQSSSTGLTMQAIERAMESEQSSSTGLTIQTIERAMGSEQSSSTSLTMQAIERARDITHLQELQLMAEDTFLQGIKELQLNTDKERCTWHEIKETTLMVGNQLHGEVKESIPLNSQVGFQITEPIVSHAEESTPIFPSSNSIGDHAEGNLVSLPCFEEADDASIPGSKSSNSNMFPLHKDREHALEENNSQSISTDEIQVEENLILAPEDNIEEDMGNNITDKVASGVASGIDLDITSPLSTSPPSFHFHVNDLEASDAFVSPCDSVDLDSKSPESGICKEEFSKTKIDIGLVCNAAQVESTGEFAAAEVLPQSTTDQIGATFEPFVEMSLCKHLLFKGMGAEAASKEFDAGKIDSIFFANFGPSIIKNRELVVRISDRYYPWEAAAPIILGMVSFGQGQMFRNNGMIPVDEDKSGYKRDNSTVIGPSKGTWKFWPFSFTKERTVTVQHLVSTEVNKQNVEVPSQGILSEVSSMKKYVQSLTPSDEQLASLNLKEGCNLVNFNFETSVLGKQQVNARIYLWKWNTRIVVSDVDGTITKSDVLGQFMPLVGKDWSQTGVAHLFSSIKDNGYQFLYLSARAISQAYLTRQFLFNLKQDNKSLPDGPVVISPDGLFPSLYREVIRRAPHEFKISCLEDIKALFPPDSNPFYAGFGNRHTDEISYLKVGIPKGKIFTINPKGEVATQHWVNTKSYSSLHSLVDVMFPAACWSEQEEFNSVNFWRVPLRGIDT